MGNISTSPVFRGPQVAANILSLRDAHKQLAQPVSWQVDPSDVERTQRAMNDAMGGALLTASNVPRLFAQAQADMVWIEGLPSQYHPGTVNVETVLIGRLAVGQDTLEGDRIQAGGGLAEIGAIATSAAAQCPSEKANAEEFVAVLHAAQNSDATTGKLGTVLAWSQPTMSNIALAILEAGVLTNQNNMIVEGAAACDYYCDAREPSPQAAIAPEPKVDDGTP